MKMTDALGIIETVGYTAAIQAADAAVKSANVKLGKLVKVGGGRVSIILRGDVAAVKAAVEAGTQAARNVGNVVSELVIPRPSEKLVPKFPIDPLKPEKKSAK
jgi:microcompartment protein CcmL/EutN